MTQSKRNIIKRTGPHPLWLHLNAGAAMMAAVSSEGEMFETSASMLQQAIDGVKAYQDSEIEPFERKMDVVFEINGTRVLKSKGWSGGRQILLVPSLINSWRIFDIEHDHSFMACLYDQGFSPLVIEWAKPDENISMEDYIVGQLAPICEALDIDCMIGYCMGGTMITALYAVHSNLNIDKVVLIAPPWSFDYQTIEQQARIQSLALQTHMMNKTAPRDFIQSLFWAVDPLQVFKKFQRFPNLNNPERFIRVEDWLNEGQEVSKSVIQTCLFDWYRDNKISKRKWKINDVIIDDKNLPDKTLIVVGEKDHLVPVISTKPLMNNRKTISVDTGHIGLMASEKSADVMWKKICGFIAGQYV